MGVVSLYAPCSDVFMGFRKRPMRGAAVCRRSSKYMFLKILQHLQENTEIFKNSFFIEHLRWLLPQWHEID